MFICTECVENYEGPAVDVAKAFGRMGMSFGPCELCHKTMGCYDIPSSANWQRKKEN